MDLKILSWNVRGMGNRDKMVAINQNIIVAKPDIICLLETKIQAMCDRIVSDVWGSNTKSGLALALWGASNGILMVWNEEIVEMLEFEMDACSISIRCCIKGKIED